MPILHMYNNERNIEQDLYFYLTASYASEHFTSWDRGGENEEMRFQLLNSSDPSSSCFQ